MLGGSLARLCLLASGLWLVGCGGSEPSGHSSASAPTHERPELPGPELIAVGEVPAERSTPEPLEEVPERVPMVAVGALHSCALLGDGAVHCWGSQRFGALGDPALGPGPEVSRTIAAPIVGVQGVRQISAGTWHQCALGREGRVWCWGHNGFGQATGVSGADEVRPSVVAGLPDAVEVTSGERHTCARTAMREVFCWGSNDFGQLGRSGDASGSVPERVEGLSGIVQIAAGRMHTCARDTEGQVSCWGLNTDGQLADGSQSLPVGHRDAPAAIHGDPGIAWVSAGGAQTCVATEAGGWLCWGRNDSAQLGSGRGGAPDDVALEGERLLGGTVPGRLSLGSRHSCMVEQGQVRCVGYNRSGQLGDGQRRLRRRPVAVRGLPSGVLSVGAGVHHSCALSSEGVWCWGRGRNGELGDGNGVDSRRPVRVTGSLSNMPGELAAPEPT